MVANGQLPSDALERDQLFWDLLMFVSLGSDSRRLGSPPFSGALRGNRLGISLSLVLCQATC